MLTGRVARPAALLGAILLAAPACGGGESSGGNAGGTGGTLIATGGTSGSGGAGGTSGSAGSGARNACPDGPGLPGDPRQQNVQSLRAQLVDLDGNGAVESPQLCGVDVCVFIEDADAAGNLTILPARAFDRPALKNGLGLRYARFAFVLPDQADHDLGAFRTVRLPDFGQGMPLVAGTEARSGPATLVLSGDAKVEIDILTYRTEEERTFRCAAMPVAQAPPALDPSLGLELLFALSPVDTVICPAARLSVENSAGWAATTAVEFFVHGVSIEEHWAPYGGWAKVSDGAVSADGTLITTAESGGLPVLGVIGIRRTP
jgi:hypothetical protein